MDAPLPRSRSSRVGLGELEILRRNHGVILRGLRSQAEQKGRNGAAPTKR